MTNLAICKNCRALTADTDEDIAEHRRKHKEQASDIERARRAASDAQSALEILQGVMRDYERALDQRPVPVEPEITMRVVEDDEDDDNSPSPYVDDDIAFPTTATQADNDDDDDFRQPRTLP